MRNATIYKLVEIRRELYYSLTIPYPYHSKEFVLRRYSAVNTAALSTILAVYSHIDVSLQNGDGKPMIASIYFEDWKT